MKKNSDPMRVPVRFAVSVLLAVGLMQPAGAAIELDSIVAVVNDDIILRSELDERLRTVRNQLREQGTPMPPLSILEKQVLDRLILNKLQIQMALETGIRVDDETLNRTITNIAAENQLSLAEFRKILEEDGYRYEKFREDIRDEILVSRLRQRQVDNRVMVSEREVDNLLSTAVHQGDVEQEFHLRHILVALPDSPSASQLEEARKRAERIWNDLRAGADFREIAIANSDGAQALEGGDLGWRKAAQIPTLFAEFVADMAVGEISEIIRSPSGFHIITVAGMRDSEQIVVTQTHSRHILIRPDEMLRSEDARARLEGLRERIRRGDDFAELARAHSHDTVSAAEGGDLGWMSPGDLVPEFESVMDTLQAGEISEPFMTPFGWHIVQVLERREHDSTEDVKRARARESIRRRKLEEARESWLREMRDEAYVEYRLQR
jgi:peptidyl-prolyl cis-trans isomerase SurA